MPTILANGLTIAYDVVGAGPPLLVLHGATTSGGQDLASQLDNLADRRSSSTCPMPVATAGRRGIRSAASGPRTW